MIRCGRNGEEVLSEPYMTLGHILYDARLARHMSRAELAKALDLNPNSIAKYEKAGDADGQYPPLPKLARLAAFFGLDARGLLSACAESDEDAELIYTMNRDTRTQEEIEEQEFERWLSHKVKEMDARIEALEASNNKEPVEVGLAASSTGSERDPKE